MVSTNKALRETMLSATFSVNLYIDRLERMEIQRQAEECVVVPAFDPRRRKKSFTLESQKKKRKEPAQGKEIFHFLRQPMTGHGSLI